ncbi:hypothetical protein ACJMK2_023980, partial [Sinanodonta woodiana]
DEKNQILTTNTWLNQIWIDYSLQWSPEKYGGIKVIRLPHDSVWKPDILLYNNADVSTFLSSISSNVIITSDGNVTWLSMVIFKSSCHINVQYFPFDEQNCSMQFASWTYDGFQVNLVLNTHEGDVSNYIPNSEWNLQRLYVQRNVVYYSCCEEPYPDITFYIHIRRRPLFYVFNMVLPCILITLVALLGFYIPSDSGEKVTMGITTLLSMTVFMMLVAENMPPTSNALPLIGIYYGITIFIVSAATGMTVLTLNIHFHGHHGREVPKIIKSICLGFLAKIFCISIQKPVPPFRHNCLYTLDTESTPDKNAYLRFQPSTQEIDPNGARSDFSSLVPDTHIHRAEEEKKLHANVAAKIHSEKPPATNGFLPQISLFRNQESGRTNFSEAYEQDFMRVLNKVSNTIEKNETRLAEQEYRDIVRLQWQQVAQVVDRLLLSIFMVITLITIFGVMFRAPLTGE